MVARLLEVFLCSFLDIEISKFRKDLLLVFFGHKLNLISGETTSSNQLNCNMSTFHRAKNTAQ